MHQHTAQTEAAASRAFNAERAAAHDTTDVSALRTTWAKAMIAHPYNKAAHLAAYEAYRVALAGTPEGQRQSLAQMAR